MWPAGTQRHRHVADLQRLAIGERLDVPGAPPSPSRACMTAIVSARRQHGAVAGARVIGMAVRDDRALDRAVRVDVKAAGPAVEAACDRP